jgi:DNA repair photolyase
MSDAKKLNGKAIYRPSGKAGEYAEYACNFYVGCSNGCKYCYLTKGWSAKTYKHCYPKLKKHFRDEDHALTIFAKELKANLPELQKHGLFFSFTTDPMLEETIDLTLFAVEKCIENSVPVKILTKKADTTEFCFLGGVVGVGLKQKLFQRHADQISIGFTLTGHDELEPNASTNSERIDAMRQLHAAGFKTFASIEPIIDFEASAIIMEDARPFCDLYKIGLESGRKYDKSELIRFVKHCLCTASYLGSKLYFKDSLLKRAGISRSELPNSCIASNYNIFNRE